jgi:hypothetical protein
MARWREDLVYRPDLRDRRVYERLYRLYRALADGDGVVVNVMRKLSELR